MQASCSLDLGQALVLLQKQHEGEATVLVSLAMSSWVNISLTAIAVVVKLGTSEPADDIVVMEGNPLHFMLPERSERSSQRAGPFHHLAAGEGRSGQHHSLLENSSQRRCLKF
jgi:hypothetical protein